MKIDGVTGEVTLQSGFSFGCRTPLAIFQAHKECEDWSEDNRSFSIVALKIENKPLKLRLSLSKHFVSHCNFDINLLDHEPPFTWDEFSYELQAHELEIYRGILNDSLGKPNEILRSTVNGDEFSVLNQYQIWNLDWGSAYAGAHPKDGFVRAGFSYNSSQQRINHESQQTDSFWNSLVNIFRPTRR